MADSAGWASDLTITFSLKVGLTLSAMASKRGWRAKIPMIQVIGKKRKKIVQKPIPIPQKGLSVVGKHKAGARGVGAVGVVGFLSSISFTVDR